MTLRGTGSRGLGLVGLCRPWTFVRGGFSHVAHSGWGLQGRAGLSFAEWMSAPSRDGCLEGEASFQVLGPHLLPLGSRLSVASGFDHQMTCSFAFESPEHLQGLGRMHRGWEASLFPGWPELLCSAQRCSRDCRWPRGPCVWVGGWGLWRPTHPPTGCRGPCPSVGGSRPFPLM